MLPLEPATSLLPRSWSKFALDPSANANDWIGNDCRGSRTLNPSMLSESSPLPIESTSSESPLALNVTDPAVIPAPNCTTFALVDDGDTASEIFSAPPPVLYSNVSCPDPPTSVSPPYPPTRVSGPLVLPVTT